MSETTPSETTATQSSVVKGDNRELIEAIEEWSGQAKYHAEAGFQIKTNQQVVTLAIDDESSCCESWGYFLTEQDATKFVGAELRGIQITDTNRSGRKFVTDYTSKYSENDIHLDEGDVMFVDIETDRGVLQFVAYNSHNGYYGHTARVSSQQLTHSETL